MTTIERITTAEQLWNAGDLGPCELVRGELALMSPAGFEHGRVAGRISARLSRFVEEHHLGVVASGDTGFVLARNPDTVRAPDVAFVVTERVPRDSRARFFEGAPDLAVEVLSPDDRAGECLAKVQSWLEAGTQVVWVVDPELLTVSVYRRDGSVSMLHRTDRLSGEKIFPGFWVPVAELFAL